MIQSVKISLKKEIDLYNMTENEAGLVIEACSFLDGDRPISVFDEKIIHTESGKTECRYSVRHFNQYLLLKKDLE